MRRNRILLIAWLALCGPSGAQEDKPFEEALKEMEGFQKEILDGNARAEELYGYFNAAKTIQKELDRVGSRLDTAGSWGGSLWLQVFPDNGLFGFSHYPAGSTCPQAAVTDSINYVRGARVVDAEDLAYLRGAMAEYRKLRDEAFKLVERKVQTQARWALAKAEEREAIDRELADLHPRVNAAIRATPIVSLRNPPWDHRVERKEGLLMGLRHVLVALDLQTRNALAEAAFWQRVESTRAFEPLDSARIRAVDGRRALPPGVVVSWYIRKARSDPWTALGTGAPEFRVPEGRAFQVYGEFMHQGRRRVLPVVDFQVGPGAGQAFWNKVFLLTGDAIYWYKQAQRRTQTYGALWASNPAAPRTLAMATDPSGAPYVPASGDIVLRTAGALSQVMFLLGSPESPQLHSGILKVEVFRNQRVRLVHQVNALGYEVVPLTPADAVLDQAMRALPAPARSFMEDANVGTVELHRPVATRDGKPDPHFNVIAAARAPEIGRRVTGYDFGFLESSTLADKFGGSMYCNEFVRDCLGRDLVAPAENPLLKDFWRAALEYDREASQERAAFGPGALERLLKSIDLRQVTFDDRDAEQDARLREQVGGLIQALLKLASGASLRRLFTQAVTDQIDLPAELSKKAGIPPAYSPLMAIGSNPALRSWIQVGEQFVAEKLVEELIVDLGNAVGTAQVLAGGEATDDQGKVRVVFRKITP